LDVILIGAPGSGKGTQAKYLIDNLKYVHLSTGDLCREEIRSGSSVGLNLRKILESGNLVPDEVIYNLIKYKISSVERNFVFDGFPRNLSQAIFFNENLMKNRFFIAIYLEINFHDLETRLVNRRMSSDGKFTYNLITSPPKNAGVCDHTGLALIQRDDDKLEVVKNRIEVFKVQTLPVVEYLKSLKKLVFINASLSVEKIREQILSHVLNK